MEEIWKDIKGYEGIYQVSNMGRIKSLNRCDSNNHLLYGKLLKPEKTIYGYHQITLCKNGKTQKYKIHRLVCTHFLPNPENKPYIDHINCNRTDNRVENLRWVTHKENMNNPLTTQKIGNANSRTHKKPIIQFSNNCDYIKLWKSATDIERELGISKVSVGACCKNKPHHLTAGGYKWGYAEDYEKIPFKVFDLEIYRKKVA